MTPQPIAETRGNDERTTGGKGAVRSRLPRRITRWRRAKPKVENFHVMNKSG